MPLEVDDLVRVVAGGADADLWFGWGPWRGPATVAWIWSHKSDHFAEANAMGVSCLISFSSPHSRATAVGFGIAKSSEAS